jgi:ABC-type lipoprotein export system ATPase subunit
MAKTKGLFPGGSEWRKWDLHIHSDASDGKMNCEQIIQNAIKKDLSVIAITDHHTAMNVDTIRELGKASNLYTIAGIEFRTEYGSRSVHLIGLFPEETDDYKLDSKNLHDLVLNPLGLSVATITARGKKRLSELKESDLDDDKAFKYGLFCVQVDFKKAADLIHKLGGIVIPHAGSKSHSIEKEMKHEGKPGVTLYDSLGTVKQELFEEGYIDICEISSEGDDASFYLNTFSTPSIIASDAHTVSEIGRRFSWIKCDPTFEGLRQAIREPESRIFIGDLPPLLQRVKLKPTKYFRGLSIRPVPGYSGEVGKWFDDVEIEFNPELVAIIGNKGSGKSAIADILGLCTNSKRESYFTFLKPKRFRMKGYANNFIAELEWASEESRKSKNLMDKVDQTQPEIAKYMPQGYFEELCNEIENLDQFNREINEVVFQHVPEDLRLGKNSFESFLEYKSKVIDSEISKLKSQLQDQNRSIIKLEMMRHQLVKEELTNQLAHKEEELNALARPKVVRDPSKRKGRKGEVASIATSISTIDKNIQQIEGEIDKSKKKRGEINIDIEALVQFKQESLVYKNEITEFVKTKKAQLKRIKEVRPEEVIKINVDVSSIERAVKELRVSMSGLDLLLSDTSIVDDTGNELSLYVKKELCEKERERLRKVLDKPNRAYQAYLAEKKIWETEKSDIIGTKDTPGTIRYFKSQLKYIETKLDQDIEKKRSEREEIVRAVYSRKKEIIEIYSDIKSFVSRTLEEHFEATEDYPIQIVGELIIKPQFQEKLLDFINKSVSGNYRGIEEARIHLARLLEGIDFNNETSVITFINSMIHSLERELYDGQEITRYIDDQVEDIEGLYEYLFGLEFLDQNFQLKLGDKSLETLSPGEKGALLLVFYLLLDKSEVPLILDQPEDNLDNQSVFQILVPFIKDAKNRRQIIMITHNPNLAVVADAEQIIRTDIQKTHNHDFKISSGSIENPIIRKDIVDVLEGTMPAFMNRSGKYIQSRTTH